MRVSSFHLSLLSIVAAGCATSPGSDVGDAGGIVFPSGTPDAGGVVIVGSADAGLPSITIPSPAPDSGGSSGPDTGGSAPAPDASPPPPPPPADAGTPVDAAHVDSSTPDAATGAVPTTCAETDGVTGCCGPGGVNYFCASDGVTVSSATCPSGQVCTWSAANMDYECAAAPAQADPSGTYPMACVAGAPLDAGAPVDASSGGTPTTCAQANATIGCCGANGDNYYCATGSSTVKATACGAGKVCTWSASKGYYACATGTTSAADPSGVNPIACQ